MVGFFHGDMAPNSDGKRPESLPVGADCTLSPLPASTPSNHRVVCSPDLPALCIAPALGEEAAVDSSTPPSEKLQCTVCSKTFTHKTTFQNHLKTHGKEGDDPYQCNFCGKTFAVPARLTRHYRTHTGEKPYQCEYCNKSFSVKENLSVHRRIHTKERPYKCDVCDRAFEHSGKLHRHMRIHTGERPHKCNICNKTFIQSGQLVIHMRTHTGEKPVCRSCGKGFTCSKQLKVHTRTHTGEKPYSCDICGKSFGYNHVLKLHQVAHYGEKVYKCTICNETFTSKKNMENHIKTHSESSSTRPEGEFSCGSTTSDKENKGEDRESDSPKPQSPDMMLRSPDLRPTDLRPRPHASESLPPLSSPTRELQSAGGRNLREICEYLYPMMPATSHHAMSPALLALATAAEAEERRHYYSPPLREGSPSGSHSSYSSPQSPLTPALPVTEPNVYLVPETMASLTRRGFCSPPPDLSSPSPSPSPAHSPSPGPEPAPLVVTLQGRSHHLILPPRKRSKMILESMEVAAVRYSSVIHYAGGALTE
uniref:Kruppel-like protein 1 n=1 Tax=Bactericera cockerelli TaxID=290155 RepID=A0A4P8J3P8_9HEMI|nr:Kruppel-like protein 1 [Bactericera cockerelli]